jgi:methyl-accepting chemotaxis protein
VEGILFVGVEQTRVMGVIWGVVKTKAVTLVVIIGAAAVLVNLAVSRSLAALERIGGAVAELAAGRLDQGVPDMTRRDEFGDLARNVETLRLGLTSAEAERRRAASSRAEAAEARARMLADLQEGVGAVVAAACLGEFEKRVETRFDAPELAALAGGVNRLSEASAAFLSDLEGTLDALADRDLTKTMSEGHKGRFHRLAQAANRSLAQLAETLDEVRIGADANRGAVGSITEAVRALSSRAEVEAATIEETSATMEEMTRSVSAAADSLSGAEVMTGEALVRAKGGATSVAQAIDAVRRIEESSARITEIIAVIDAIAFQTNLLALNAAVEAARAGDAGKGFAVVASEVRSLAQRSSEAARDITDLIKKSAAHVAEGVERVNDTGGALREIVQSVDRLSAAIRDIAASGREQGAGVREIGAAIAHIDGMVQANALQTTQVAAETAVVAKAVEKNAEALAGFITRAKAGARSPKGPRLVS